MNNVKGIISKIKDNCEYGFRGFLADTINDISNNYRVITSEDWDNHKFKYKVVVNYSSFESAFESMVGGYKGQFDVPEGIDSISDNIGVCDLFIGKITDVEKIYDKIVSFDETTISDELIDLNFAKYMDALDGVLRTTSVYNPKGTDWINIFPDEVLCDHVRKSTNLDDDIEHVMESFDISEEAKDPKEIMNNVKDKRDKLKSVLESALRVKRKINESKMDINRFIDKFNIPRVAFYKRFVGKIDGLYDRYSSEVTLVEQELAGDPVDILMNKAPNYLKNLTKGVKDIYSNFNSHIDSLFKAETYDKMVELTNRYITYKEVKLETNVKPSAFRKALMKDLRFKIASVLLKDHKVYGHNIQSIIDNKYPPISHVIVCLFIPNPHEEAVRMKVSDIFKSSKSLHVMGKSMRKIIVTNSKITSSILSSKDISDSYNSVETGYSKFIKNNSRGEIAGKSDGSNKQIAEDLRKRKSVLKSHKQVLEAFIPLYLYTADAGNVLYDISLKIDKLARTAITGMLNVEKKSSANYGYKDGTSKTKIETSGKSKNEIELDKSKK